MRPIVALSFVVVAAVGAALPLGCGSGGSSSGFPGGDGGTGSSSGSGGSSGGSSSSGGGSGSSSGVSLGDGGGSGSSSGGGDGGSTTVTTVYATTDSELWSVDPKTMAVTDVGGFGLGDAGDDDITDVAVDSKGNIFVNTTSTLYQVTLPSKTPGTLTLTQVASLGTTYFYALGFAPAGALDPNNDVLVAGDGNGALWWINTTSGASTQLGTFGANAQSKGESWELSGDVVFYLDSVSSKPVGLATIRSCTSSGTCGNDFLAQIDMTALQTAYKSGTPASTLLYGIYGATKTSNGPGTGYYGVFGLAAWDSTVFGFTYAGSSKYTPYLITIDTTSGKGTATSNTFPFYNGWSGAGVSSKTTISVPQPPPVTQ